MTLPADVARCLGTDLPECATCRRRTDPPHDRQTWTGPWELEGVPCEMRIPICTIPSTTLNTTLEDEGLITRCGKTEVNAIIWAWNPPTKDNP